MEYESRGMADVDGRDVVLNSVDRAGTGDGWLTAEGVGEDRGSNGDWVGGLNSYWGGSDTYMCFIELRIHEMGTYTRQCTIAHRTTPHPCVFVHIPVVVTSTHIYIHTHLQYISHGRGLEPLRR